MAGSKLPLRRSVGKMCRRRYTRFMIGARPLFAMDGADTAPDS